MAITVLHKKQTSGGIANASITGLTSATKGNLLVAFVSQASATAAPTMSDNLGSSGWTVNETKALFKTSLSSVWVATKTAAGGETEIKAAPASGGTIQGLCYFELEGASATVDAITHADNSKATKQTSTAITTTDAGGITLACVGTEAGTGVITTWEASSGTAPTNVETVSARTVGGSLIPGVTLAAVTFTANWTNSVNSGMLVVALKAAIIGASIPVHGGGKTAHTADARHEGSQTVHGGGLTKITSSAAGEAHLQVHGGGQTKTTADALHEGSTAVHGGGNTAVLGEAMSSAVIKVVHKKQTAGGIANSSLTGLTAAAAGDLLVAFISQANSTSAPTVSDNLGSTGWTVNETHAVYQTSAHSVWVATKVAVGGETEIKGTPAAGGAIEGICYFELEGASETVDVIAHTDNGKGTSGSTPAVSTSSPGDIILACVGSATGTGTIGEWTGTGPLHNVETVSTRTLGGSLAPGILESGAVFTAHWTVSINFGVVVLALFQAGLVKVHGGGLVKRASFVVQGTSPHASAAGDTPVLGEVAPGTGIPVHGGGQTRVTGSTSLAIHGGGLVKRTSFATREGSQAIHGGGNTLVAGTSAHEPVAVAVHGGGRTFTAGYVGSIACHGGGRVTRISFTPESRTVVVHGGGETRCRSTAAIEGGQGVGEVRLVNQAEGTVRIL